MLLSDKIKQFLKKDKVENVNILLVSMQPNVYLFERWCTLDMINSGSEATKETVFEFIAIEEELKRRGYGDEDGKIIPSKIDNFYEGIFYKNDK